MIFALTIKIMLGFYFFLSLHTKKSTRKNCKYAHSQRQTAFTVGYISFKFFSIHFCLIVIKIMWYIQIMHNGIEVYFPLFIKELHAHHRKAASQRFVSYSSSKPYPKSQAHHHEF